MLPTPTTTRREPVRIELQLRAVDGALLRVLSLLQRRGCEVLSVRSHTDQQRQAIEATLVGRTPRSPFTLLAELQRLVDVRRACVTLLALPGCRSPDLAPSATLS